MKLWRLKKFRKVASGSNYDEATVEEMQTFMDSLQQEINAKIAESGFDGTADAVVQAVDDSEDEILKYFGSFETSFVDFENFETSSADEEATVEEVQTSMASLQQEINAKIAESGFGGTADAVLQAVDSCEEKLVKYFGSFETSFVDGKPSLLEIYLDASMEEVQIFVDSLQQDINAKIADSGFDGDEAFDGTDDVVLQAVNDCEEKLGKSFRNLLRLTFQSFEEKEATPGDDTSLNEDTTSAVVDAVVDAVKDGGATPMEEEVAPGKEEDGCEEGGGMDPCDIGQFMCCFSAPWHDDSSSAPSLASSSCSMESDAVVTVFV